MTLPPPCLRDEAPLQKRQSLLFPRPSSWFACPEYITPKGQLSHFMLPGEQWFGSKVPFGRRMCFFRTPSMHVREEHSSPDRSLEDDFPEERVEWSWKEAQISSILSEACVFFYFKVWKGFSLSTEKNDTSFVKPSSTVSNCTYGKQSKKFKCIRMTTACNFYII